MTPANLKKYFWDVDFGQIDLQKNKKYVLERLLEMGDMEAVKWMRKNFSERDILEVLRNSSKLSKQTVGYWELVLRK